MLTAILMIVFRKDLVDFVELWYEAMPKVLRTFQPHAGLLTVFIITFGALFFLAGLMVLLVNLV